MFTDELNRKLGKKQEQNVETTTIKIKPKNQKQIVINYFQNKKVFIERKCVD